MKKWLFLLLALLLAGCNTNSASEKAQTAEGKEKKKEKVTIMLDWYPNAVHSFLYVAEEKGYFDAEGIDVDIQFPANPTDPIQLAAAGKVTLGISYQPDVIMARTDQGVKVKSVGAIVRSPLNRVMFLKDSPIQRPKDLEGKTVGFTGIPLNEAIIETMVAKDKGNPKKVNMIDVGFELNSAVVTKKADAVVGAYINHEVPLLKHEGHETRNFDPTKYGVPNFYELVAVTSDETWEKQQDTIKAFWRAAEKGFDFTEQHPDEALSILLSKQDEANFPLIEEVEKQSLDILLPKMKSEKGFGSQTKESWIETAEWMKASGLIKKEPKLEEVFVNIAD
ncbi:ABC transporter substrate-binding protein [Pseudobacillus wudalianchiensis]|uniref:ABC transporter substrate-binding protein n=1 Tax=Pseudobacillus wudalianchiensis TaxID=1743143 RepID=A0A1B9ATU4_9BACI|nr:ABC transporter substrate-binding protein [Bacillus wudalianchiensis]OCA87108.1 ABC transporter substrate-binding protein [Bacillus wudalianchiensis]